MNIWQFRPFFKPLDPDSESGSRRPLNPYPIWIRIRNTAGILKIQSRIRKKSLRIHNTAIEPTSLVYCPSMFANQGMSVSPYRCEFPHLPWLNKKTLENWIAAHSTTIKCRDSSATTCCGQLAALHTLAEWKGFCHFAS